MSYRAIQTEFYEMNEPQTPWHPGGDGWQQAPWPSWGDNPNQVGPKRQGVGGCGCSGATPAVGDESAPPSSNALVLTLGALVMLGGIAYFARH